MWRYTRCKWETWQLPLSGGPGSLFGGGKRRWRKTDLLFLRVRFLCMSLTSSSPPPSDARGGGGGGKKRRFLTWITRGGGQKSTKPEDRRQKTHKRKKIVVAFSLFFNLFFPSTNGRRVRKYRRHTAEHHNKGARPSSLLQFFRAFELPLRPVPTLFLF